MLGEEHRLRVFTGRAGMQNICIKEGRGDTRLVGIISVHRRNLLRAISYH
jgi:hypothetical protein